MRGQVKIAAGVLAAVLAVMLWTTFTVLGRCDRLIGKTETAMAQISAGDDPGAALAALAEEWQNSGCVLRRLLPNTVLTDLNEAIARLAPEYSLSQDSLAPELAGILADLRWVRERSDFF